MVVASLIGGPSPRHATLFFPVHYSVRCSTIPRSIASLPPPLRSVSISRASYPVFLHQSLSFFHYPTRPLSVLTLRADSFSFPHLRVLAHLPDTARLSPQYPAQLLGPPPFFPFFFWPVQPPPPHPYMGERFCRFLPCLSQRPPLFFGTPLRTYFRIEPTPALGYITRSCSSLYAPSLSHSIVLAAHTYGSSVPLTRLWLLRKHLPTALLGCPASFSTISSFTRSLSFGPRCRALFVFCARVTLRRRFVKPWLSITHAGARSHRYTLHVALLVIE